MKKLLLMMATLISINVAYAEVRLTEVIRKTPESGKYCSKVDEFNTCLMTATQALQYCARPGANQHLPSIQEYIAFAKKNGARGILNDGGNDCGGQYILAEDLNVKNDNRGYVRSYCYSSDGYIRPGAETEKSQEDILWTSSASIPFTSTSAFAFNYYRGSFDDTLSIERLSAVRCAEIKSYQEFNDFYQKLVLRFENANISVCAKSKAGTLAPLSIETSFSLQEGTFVNSYAKLNGSNCSDQSGGGFTCTLLTSGITWFAMGPTGEVNHDEKKKLISGGFQIDFKTDFVGEGSQATLTIQSEYPEYVIPKISLVYHMPDSSDPEEPNYSIQTLLPNDSSCWR